MATVKVVKNLIFLKIDVETIMFSKIKSVFLKPPPTLFDLFNCFLNLCVLPDICHKRSIKAGKTFLKMTFFALQWRDESCRARRVKVESFTTRVVMSYFTRVRCIFPKFVFWFLPALAALHFFCWSVFPFP